jgi:hypothetical protein
MYVLSGMWADGQGASQGGVRVRLAPAPAPEGDEAGAAEGTPLKDDPEMELLALHGPSRRGVFLCR